MILSLTARSLLAVLFGFMASAAVACQESIIEHPLAYRLILKNADGAPLRRARIIVREAFGSSEQRTRWGTPIGKIVRRGKTDRHGQFSLRGLAGKQYWVTYEDGNGGESFLLVRRKDSVDEAELRLNQFHNLCYLFDIERNSTKPPNWPHPIATKISQ